MKSNNNISGIALYIDSKYKGVIKMYWRSARAIEWVTIAFASRRYLVKKFSKVDKSIKVIFKYI